MSGRDNPFGINTARFVCRLPSYSEGGCYGNRMVVGLWQIWAGGRRRGNLDRSGGLSLSSVLSRGPWMLMAAF